MDLKNLFALLVVIVMVGSMAAYTVFYKFPDTEGPNENGQPDQNPTAIDFEASGVKATIVQLLPSIMVQAETSETDLMKINNSIYSIQGIKGVNGRFQQYPYTALGTGFIYVADISYSADLNSSFVIEKLESGTVLSYVNGRGYVLVELPKIVPMQSVDQKLGLSRDYNLSENLSEALVGLGSIEGDSLLVKVTATFVGNDATNTMAFEEKNLTAAPVAKSALLEAPIASLGQLLVFSADFSYGLLDNVSSLEKDINAIEGVAGAKVFVSGPEAKVSIDGNAAAEDAFSQLQAFLNDLNAANVSLSNNPLKGSVSFAEGISSAAFAEKKALVEAKIKELDVNASATEETGFLSGEASLSSADSKQQGALIDNLLSSKKLSFDLRQPGKISLQEIHGPEPESSASYAVPSGLVQAELFPGHKAGDTVSVLVDFTLVRGAIDSISAEEKK